MKNKTIILIIVIGILLSTCLTVTLIFLSKEKTAYANLGEVYNGFSMKKILESRLNTTKQTRQNYLDSINLIITQQQKYYEKSGGNDLKFKALIEENRIVLEDKEHEFAASLEEISQTYQNQIWKQINTYVKEYGSNNGYDYIYGTDGQGAVMYANPKRDISKEIIEYINKRYKGE